MKQAVLRAVSFESLLAVLKSLGFEVRPDADQVELTVGVCCTPPMQTATGVVSRIMLTDEQSKMLPDYITPATVLCDWHSDDREIVDGEERPLANPVYTVTDAEGTRQQEVGIFQ